jgi:hypothetical protein
MAYTLPSIPVLKMTFIFTAQQNCTLNNSKGSMLRGAFGHALKRTVCVMGPKQACETCMLRKQCVYTKIFETFIEGEPPQFLQGLQTSPRPYIIDAYDTNTTYAKGDQLEFDLTLIGRVCELHPYVIFAVSQMAERGFTKNRIPFTLTKVNWRHDNSGAEEGQQSMDVRVLYKGETQCLCEIATPALISANGNLISPLSIQFLTPTRLKFRNQLSIDFSFRMLVFKMLRRVLEIAHFHVPDAEPDWQFHSLLEQADTIDITNRDLHWQDWHRYSNRQQAGMDMGGFIGTISLDGDFEPFSDLLRLSEIIHVGKGTTFGLGKIIINSS